MNPADPAARIGQVLDRYRLEGVIGAGGFGTVYRARHTVMNRVVALKLLHGRPDEDQRQRFVREAQATAAIEHPSIVQVFDFGTTEDGEMFLAMELLEGEELELRRLRAPLPPYEALRIMCEVLAALAHAHRAGVVHRDLKPANIFLTAGGVKLLDFGISMVRDDATERMTRTGLVMGTPLYMAPESFSGVREVDERVDVYAVAAMLYELLSGQSVYAADSYEQLVVKVATERATPMAQVAPGAPAALAAAIDRGLASRPADRWPSAAAFREALLPFAGADSSHEAHPAPGAVAHSTAQATSSPTKPAWRPSVIAAGAVALLGASFVAAALLMDSGTSGTEAAQEESSGGLGAPSGLAAGGAIGTCAAPLVLHLGVPLAANTRGGGSTLTPSCGDEGAPEQVHALQVHTRMQVSVRVEAGFDAVLSLTSGCGAGNRELACNDDYASEMNRSQISELLEPGTYFLSVDGFGGESGPYTIVANGVEPSQDEQCTGAPALTPDVDVHGSTEGRPNVFESTCVSEPSGPDMAYRFDIAEPSRVRLRQHAEEDGALHLRRDCARAQSEVACNDDHGDSSRSVITEHLDAGAYWVISDGFDETDGGPYTLRAEVLADSARSAVDGCAAPQHMTSTSALTDTFHSANQTQGSCGGAGGPEQVFAFEMQTPGRVRVEVLESEFRGVYYIRSRCQDSTSELFCGGFANGVGVDETQGELAVHELAAGAYFLIVDGTTIGDFGAANVHVIRTR
ncbi:MAG: serine/threonine-protein kinase [Polyangiales bacterium]